MTWKIGQKIAEKLCYHLSKLEDNLFYMSTNGLDERIKEENRELEKLESKLTDKKREVAEIERDISKVRTNLSLHQSELDRAQAAMAKTPEEKK